jgi:5,10-methylenetetrahydromethanopterin reductase
VRIGINGSASGSSVDEVVAAARLCADSGFSSFWLAQIFGVDALTALAVAGREVPDIELGTAVVPVQPRHPQMLAGQALTTQAATRGRLTLGIGLSHQVVVENMWGMSYGQPVAYLREYLDALLPLLRGENAEVRGERITAVGSVQVADAPAPPLLIAALGPKMLELAGSVGAGTITWCTGERALADHIVPRITDAAARAGQPAPRVVASLPVCVTDDVAGARAAIAKGLAMYGTLPSYRAMLDLDGAESPADIAVVGDEADVTAQLDRLADAGVTDFVAAVSTHTDSEATRTHRLLAGLAR